MPRLDLLLVSSLTEIILKLRLIINNVVTYFQFIGTK